MMNRRDALLLVDRLKRRTRDPDVLTLCEYVHGTDVHGTIPAFRRPNDGPPPAVFPSASCPVSRHVGRQRRRGRKDGDIGAGPDADVRVAWAPRSERASTASQSSRLLSPPSGWPTRQA